jgi:flagellar hook assembly protein FlgD
VDLAVYDVAGRRVASIMNTQMGRGLHNVSWNGRDQAGRALASGVYFVRLSLDGNTVETRRVTRVR